MNAGIKAATFLHKFIVGSGLKSARPSRHRESAIFCKRLQLAAMAAA
jgi:hypothetical protein